MKAWLAARTPRERQILLAGATVIVLALLYGAILHPFYAGLAQLRRTAVEQQALLHWMHGAADEVRALRRAGLASTPATGGSILSVVDQAARREHLENAVQRMDPDNAGGVRVTLQGAPFDAVVRWLGALQHDAGLRIASATFEASGAPGQVNGHVVLKGSGS